MTKNEKISQALKKRFSKQPHHKKGKAGKKHDKIAKQKIREALIKHYDSAGRMSDAQKKARNKANVYAYRARKRNAIPENANLALIKLIYEKCPEGYHVDHIIALASGGLHHQDNLQYLPIAENCRKGKSNNYNSSLAKDWRDFIGM